MKLSDYNYHLPKERIAHFPPETRGEARLLVLDKATGKTEHRQYQDIVDYLNPNDVLVLNDTKVIKARLIAHNQALDPIEIFLLEKHAEDHSSGSIIKILHRGHIYPNEVLRIADRSLVVLDTYPDGTATIQTDTDPDTLADTYGEVPLPPYMKREATPQDIARYQTVFAKKRGSVAAPTASLNMTDDLLGKIRAKGVSICYLTLHVGLGTFAPIRTDDLEGHHMHSEHYIIPADTIAKIRTAKSTGHAVVALGTTVTRALEYAHEFVLSSPSVEEGRGEADIFIYPGYQFKVIDRLITNFHAPKSTVLMLTAAFAGWDYLKNAYDSAVENKYSFLSYGDSMLIK